MFRCEECGVVTKAGVGMNRVVVETRKKEYDNANYTKTTGTEIVKELRLCPECAVVKKMDIMEMMKK